MAGFLRNIDGLVLEVYKYTWISNFPVVAWISLDKIWFDNNLEGKWAFI